MPQRNTFSIEKLGIGKLEVANAKGIPLGTENCKLLTEN